MKPHASNLKGTLVVGTGMHDPLLLARQSHPTVQISDSKCMIRSSIRVDHHLISSHLGPNPLKKMAFSLISILIIISSIQTEWEQAFSSPIWPCIYETESTPSQENFIRDQDTLSREFHQGPILVPISSPFFSSSLSFITL